MITGISFFYEIAEHTFSIIDLRDRLNFPFNPFLIVKQLFLREELFKLIRFSSELAFPARKAFHFVIFRAHSNVIVFE